MVAQRQMSEWVGLKIKRLHQHIQGGPNEMTPPFIFANSNWMRMQNSMIFGTYEVIKASIAMQILFWWKRNKLDGATCIMLALQTLCSKNTPENISTQRL